MADDYHMLSILNKMRNWVPHSDVDSRGRLRFALYKYNERLELL